MTCLLLLLWLGLFLALMNGQRVHALELTCPITATIIGTSTQGSGDGQFNQPFTVAVNASGYIYVADSGNYRIQVFDSNGVFMKKWGSYGGGNGQFDFPEGIAIDSVGQVYVVDANNNRIQVFSADGVFVSKFGSSGSGDGRFYDPWDIALDSANSI